MGILRTQNHKQFDHFVSHTACDMARVDTSLTVRYAQAIRCDQTIQKSCDQAAPGQKP